MSEFTMPSLGADMEAGTLVEWMKQPGDRIRRGEAIAAVETQKGAIEIEAYEDGVLDRILVDVGERVPVGTVLAMIRSTSEGIAPPIEVPLPAESPHRAEQAPPASEESLAGAHETRSVEPAATQPSATPSPVSAIASPRPARETARITPAALRRAQELGVDLSALHAAADGVIGLREVEAAHAGVAVTSHKAVPPGPPPRIREPAKPGLDPTEMRKAIAAAMARSWREIPHYFVSSTLDVTPMLHWLQEENLRRAVSDRLHYAAPLIKAVALALRGTPDMNGHFGPHGFEPADRIHLGIAVAMRGGGLVAPALLDADMRSLTELMAGLDSLVMRVRGGRLLSSEMTAATATFSNLGEATADNLQPVIYPPQVAIIGCGQIVERAWAREDTLSARRTLTFTVGGDHRVSDGRVAARFLGRLDELLQHPQRL